MSVDRKNIKTILARIDTENIASQKVIQKVGARKGETLFKDYGLAKDKGPDGVVPEEKLRDADCWYIDRPAEAESAGM